MTNREKSITAFVRGIKKGEFTNQADLTLLFIQTVTKKRGKKAKPVKTTKPLIKIPNEGERFSQKNPPSGKHPAFTNCSFSNTEVKIEQVLEKSDI